MEEPTQPAFNTQLPSVGTPNQPQSVAAPSAVPTAPMASAEVDQADPKQALAQYMAAAEGIIARTQQAPRARADELAALKAQYIQTQFGLTSQVQK
jgi:hypothetical protein